jgi:hypothetical protein
MGRIEVVRRNGGRAEVLKNVGKKMDVGLEIKIVIVTKSGAVELRPYRFSMLIVICSNVLVV